MRRMLVLGLMSVLAAVLMVPTASAKAGKVDVCHLNSLGRWQVNTVPEQAVTPHLNHGDALPGAPVPGMAGYTFDDDCVPVADEIIYAVAYTDVVDDGGGYDPDNDVLIAKLVDGNDDGVLNVGDLIITDQYPTNVAGTTFGNFGVKQTTVTGGLGGSPNSCFAHGAQGAHGWEMSSSREQYAESPFSSDARSSWFDIVDGGVTPDQLSIETGSPSMPEGDATDMAADGVDSTFLDVDLDCAS